jgi:hypothetical protein
VSTKSAALAIVANLVTTLNRIEDATTADLQARVLVLADAVEEAGGEGAATALRELKPLAEPPNDHAVWKFMRQQPAWDAGIRDTGRARFESPVLRDVILRQHVHPNDIVDNISPRWLNGVQAVPIPADNLQIVQFELRQHSYRYDPPGDSPYIRATAKYFDLAFERAWLAGQRPPNSVLQYWPSRHRQQDFAIGQCPVCDGVAWAWKQWPDVQAEAYRQRAVWIATPPWPEEKDAIKRFLIEGLQARGITGYDR